MRKSEYDGLKSLENTHFLKISFPFDSKMIADTKAILFVLILASEWFAGLLSHQSYIEKQKGSADFL